MQEDMKSSTKMVNIKGVSKLKNFIDGTAIVTDRPVASRATDTTNSEAFSSHNGTLVYSAGSGYYWNAGGATGIQYHFDTWNDWWTWHYDHYHYYPVYVTEKVDASKIAFKVAAELIKLDYVKDLTVDQFVKLVSSIEDIIEKYKTRWVRQ